MTKQFHLGDVLSVTTGWVLSPEGMSGLYEILNYMTDSDLNTMALCRAADQCSPKLLEQFPQFATSDFQAAFEEYKQLAEAATRDDVKSVAQQWVATQIQKYGEMFDVEPLPKGAFEEKHPIEDYLDLSGDPDKVVAIGVSQTH